MKEAVFLAVIQAVTEFLPISSSGHLALVSNIISQPPNIFFFAALHLASLAAVMLFVRRKITGLMVRDRRSMRVWGYVVIATVPAALFGLFFKDTIENAFSSFLAIGMCYIFTGIVLFLTKFSKASSAFTMKYACIIGLSQILGLFPGISRSGITISLALFLGVDRKEAAEFSFLLFIPLSIGAFVRAIGEGHYFDMALAVSFVVCFLLSFLFLRLLFFVVEKGAFWLFSIYCVAIGVVSLLLWR